MSTALFGYSGFVGKNLDRQFTITDRYNSANSSEIMGRQFDLLFFSGARAEKWKANQDPDADAKHIDELCVRIEAVQAKKAVLISTVDVYAHPVAVDESHSADISHPQAYGRNRARLEQKFRVKFPAGLILRLPGLFGPGLKKNIIFDFIHNNDVQKIDSRNSFQFYDLNWLRHDIEVCWKNDIQVMNLATEPTTVGEVARAAFERSFENVVLEAPVSYDMRSRHAALWRSENAYTRSKAQVLDAMKWFVIEESQRRA